MKDLFKRLNQARTGLNQGRAATFSDTDIDNMRPCEYFDLIVGSGTGGLIAIYLGRLKLTIKECEERLVNIGDQVYEAPFSHWNVFQRYSYDSTALEKVLKEQPGSNLPFCHQEAEGTGCKVAVLVSTGLPGSTQILRSYRHAQTNTQQDTGVWQTMRATMASYHDFPPVETGTQVLWGPDASFSNPSQVAVGEAEDLFHLRRNVDLGEPAAPGRGLCIMSLGNGLYPESAPFASTPIEYQIQLSLRKLRGIVPSLWAAARGLLPEKVHALRDLAMGCEHQHREILAKFPKEADIGTRRDNLMLYFNSSQSKYFRFNIEDEMGELLDSRTWNDASKARVDEWASTEYLSEDFTPDRLNEWELACSQL
ncbi:hypothetical protein M408DRAFT_252540 [Serendipita vermifera MAFF 305830]|uniref:PNPLA domain-containing protein n=1 Tax=Serendipita vermifera MAFF 305830 TaxID=933852 RepID=A0A0C2X2I3_SERVB|nr:hypothetical protein M408DRAFT_252540 [Serendipita vermifera MAFF 305830]